MKTLLLDRTAWDLVIDVDNNIAVASDPYAQAQDAASAIKLFQSELYYDTTKGVPYWTQILGKTFSVALLREKFKAAALTVPDVIKARVFIRGIKARTVTGQVQILDELSNPLAAANF